MHNNVGGILSSVLTFLTFVLAILANRPHCRMAVEIDPFPSPESFKGIGTSLEATGGNGKNLDHLEQAVEAYRAALRRSNKTLVLFYMGVALERLGKTEEAEQILESIQRSEAVTSCMSDSWGYVR